MMMAYNAHLLHRLFAIEKRLNTLGAFECLEQLRQALKSEGSFVESLTNLVRNGFRHSHPLFRANNAGPQRMIEVAEDAATGPALGDLNDTSHNTTKLTFLNTCEGIELRQRHPGGAGVGLGGRFTHLAAILPSHQRRRCILCNHHTSAYCKSCSNDPNGVYFVVCTTPSWSNENKNKSTCFDMLHTATKLSVDPTRKRRSSDAKQGSIGVARDAKAAKKCDAHSAELHAGHGAAAGGSEEDDAAAAADQPEFLPELVLPNAAPGPGSIA